MIEPLPITVTAPDLVGGTIAAQRWSDLAFLHWRVEAERIAALMPPGVRPDEHDGSSWVGLIPFKLDRASLFGGPAVAYIGDFVEVNVRLYGVDEQGRRGVVFRSLEASRLLAVLAAQATFQLPYRWSATRMAAVGDQRAYASRRMGGGPRSAVTVRVGDPVVASPLDEFLTARWGMFTRLGGRTRFVPNSHPTWQLRSAELLHLDDELVAAAGLPGVVERPPDSVRFSDGVITRFGRPAPDRRAS